MDNKSADCNCPNVLIGSIIDLINACVKIIQENGFFFFWSIFATIIIGYLIWNKTNYVEKSRQAEIERLVDLINHGFIRDKAVKNLKTSKQKPSKDS